ncbi:MAG: class I SAM-dependent methyltransferase [Negativicutes bacterium]
MKEKEWCVEADREFLLNRKCDWVIVHCPACGTESNRLFGEKNGFRYVQCDNCETVYTNPRPSEKLLAEFYSGSLNYAFWNDHIFPATDQARKVGIYRERAKLVKATVKKNYFENNPVSFLEIGAAFGSFCEEIRDLNIFSRIVALEPTPKLANTCRDKGFEVMESTVEKLCETEKYEVVAAFEVLEHLFSPLQFIEKCYSILNFGGLLILSCPNVKGFDVATLNMLSNTFDHEHINYLHTDSIKVLLNNGGLEIVEVLTPGKLDADIVRKQVLTGKLSLQDQPFLDEVLVKRWDELGQLFQQFLSDNKLSSHMMVVARKVK